MFEGSIGRSVADECPSLVEAFRGAATGLVVEEGVVCNLEQPRAKLSLFLITSRREVSLDQCILCKVVGFVLVAAAEVEQEAPKCPLLLFHKCYESFACHGLDLRGCFAFFGFNLLSEHLSTYAIVDDEGRTNG